MLLSRPHPYPDLHTLGEYVIVIADCRAAKLFNLQPGDTRPFITDKQFAELYRSVQRFAF